MDRTGIEMVKRESLRYSPLLLLYVMSALCLSAVLVAGNDFIARAADGVLAGQQAVFGELLLPLGALTMAGAVLACLKSLSGSSYSAKVQRALRDRMGEKLLRLPYTWFDEKGTGSIVTRLLSDMGAAGRFYAEILPDFLMDLATVLMVTLYFIRMDVRLLAVLFVGYPPMLLISDRLSKKLMAIARSKFMRMDERTALAYDYVQGMEVGRSFGLYESQKRRMDDVLDKIAAHAAASTRISSMAWLTGSVITQIPVILCYLAALYERMQGRVSVGELLSFTVLIGYAVYPMRNVIFAMNDFRETGVSLERLREILNGEEEGNGYGKAGLSAPQRQDCIRAELPVIRLNRAGFSFCAQKPVLEDISLTVYPGERIAIVGASGEGKSTILRLLCGLYEKQRGEYLLFGRRIEEWDVEAVRECFSYVSQDTVLFPVSIWQNVAYGRQGASREEAVAACREANIHDMIERLPRQYDTLVGERGTLLSGGERQRIAIARAILKNAPILLLDEPTASVDGENEKLIVEALERVAKGKTIITVAHRLSTIENADRIYVLERGRIAGQGTYEELFGKKEEEDNGRVGAGSDAEGK